MAVAVGCSLGIALIGLVFFKPWDIAFAADGKADGDAVEIVEGRPVKEYGGPALEITIDQFQFMPREIEIPTGTTVVWVQRESIEHNVHMLSESDDTPLEDDVVGPLLRRGQRFAITFYTPGVYSYMCDPHPFMTGVVKVVEPE